MIPTASGRPHGCGCFRQSSRLRLPSSTPNTLPPCMAPLGRSVRVILQNIYCVPVIGMNCDRGANTAHAPLDTAAQHVQMSVWASLGSTMKPGALLLP